MLPDVYKILTKKKENDKKVSFTTLYIPLLLADWREFANFEIISVVSMWRETILSKERWITIILFIYLNVFLFSSTKGFNHTGRVTIIPLRFMYKISILNRLILTNIV